VDLEVLAQLRLRHTRGRCEPRASRSSRRTWTAAHRSRKAAPVVVVQRLNDAVRRQLRTATNAVVGRSRRDRRTTTCVVTQQRGCHAAADRRRGADDLGELAESGAGPEALERTVVGRGQRSTHHARPWTQRVRTLAHAQPPRASGKRKTATGPNPWPALLGGSLEVEAAGPARGVERDRRASPKFEDEVGTWAPAVDSLHRGARSGSRVRGTTVFSAGTRAGLDHPRAPLPVGGRRRGPLGQRPPANCGSSGTSGTFPTRAGADACVPGLALSFLRTSVAPGLQVAVGGANRCRRCRRGNAAHRVGDQVAAWLRPLAEPSAPDAVRPWRLGEAFTCRMSSIC